MGRALGLGFFSLGFMSYSQYFLHSGLIIRDPFRQNTKLQEGPLSPTLRVPLLRVP